jgi:hypothetical protein
MLQAAMYEPSCGSVHNELMVSGSALSLSASSIAFQVTCRLTLVYCTAVVVLLSCVNSTADLDTAANQWPGLHCQCFACYCSLYCFG